MMDTIAPFWDGNETWLVVIGAGLFAAFPDVYAVFLGAFYLPVLLLLFGLIFRGVAFEFRFRSERMRWVWDWGFFLGSTVVAFVQGAAIGAMIRGIPVVNGQYAGGPFDWLHPFAILTGIGLVLGYALLGAGWLVLKSDGELRDWAYARIRWLAAGVLVVLFLAFAFTFDYSVVARSDLQARPWGLVFPAIGVLALVGVFIGARQKRDGWPFAMTALFFVAAFLSLGVMFWPYMIPYSVTVARRGGAGSLIAIPVLRRCRGAARHRRLHDRRLLGLPRQGSQGLQSSDRKRDRCHVQRVATMTHARVAQLTTEIARGNQLADARRQARRGSPPPGKRPAEGMVWIPGGTFLMGSDHHYPEEAPAHKVTVNGFWMDRYAVTNADFRRFVEATRYVTLAERPANAADYPGAKPELLEPSAVVFRKTAGPVDLRDPHNWWTYVRGANWRHPRGPGSSPAGSVEAPGRPRGLRGRRRVCEVGWKGAADRGRVGIRRARRTRRCRVRVG